MLEQLEELKSRAIGELAGINDIQELDVWRVNYLGKKSQLTGFLRTLSSLPLEERKAAGSSANETRTTLEASLKEREQTLRGIKPAASGQGDIDITLPGRPWSSGHIHPITQTIHEMCDIFATMGFQVVEGPEVEWDYYNFEALNIPEEHPARDNMSSTWIDSGTEAVEQVKLLRTHTTSVSARILETMIPPIRTIEFGKVYRYEATDATHLPMFYQLDGLAVDKNITMADLKGTLYEFARRFFGDDRKVRFRCDFFPFVEPGVEMAISCVACNGQGCRLCGNSGWLEILGAGMTHPEVLRRGGIDPDVYSSFAFGIGIERLPMLRYGIGDIRLFYGGDLRFLKQF